MSARATRSSARLKKRKPGADDEQPADLAVLAEAATATKRRRPNSPQEEAQLKQEQAAANCKSSKTLATLNRIMRELGDMLGKPGCGCHLGILRAGVKRLREQTQQLCDLREELSVVTRREVCNTAAAKLRAKIEEDFRRECAEQDEEAKAQAAAAEKEQSSASTAAAAASAAQTPEEARVQYNKRLNTMYIVIHRLLFAPRAEVDGKKYALPSCLTGAETDSDPSGMCRVQLLSSLRDRLLDVAREVRATSQLVRLAKHAKYKELMAIAGRTEDQCFHCVLRHTTKAVALGLGDGRLVEVSPAFSKLVGWSREHLLYDNGANIADILAPQTAETVMGRVAAVASGQTKCWKTNQAFFRACAPDAGAGAEPSSSSAAAAAAASAAAAPPDADAGSRLESLQEFMAKHPHRVQTKRCCMSINPVEDVSGKTFVFYMLGVPTSEGNCV